MDILWPYFGDHASTSSCTKHFMITLSVFVKPYLNKILLGTGFQFWIRLILLTLSANCYSVNTQITHHKPNYLALSGALLRKHNSMEECFSKFSAGCVHLYYLWKILNGDSRSHWDSDLERQIPWIWGQVWKSTFFSGCPGDTEHTLRDVKLEFISAIGGWFWMSVFILIVLFQLL